MGLRSTDWDSRCRIFSPVLHAYKSLDAPAHFHVAIDKLLGVIDQLVERATQVPPVNIAHYIDALETYTGHLGLAQEALWLMGK